MQPEANTNDAPLSQVERDGLYALIERVGEYRAAVLLGLARQTIARGAAGLRLRNGTRAQMREALARIEATKLVPQSGGR